MPELYKHIIRPLLFLLDPETGHHTALKIGALLARLELVRVQLAHMAGAESDMLATQLWNISFKNPFGLAAGMDKNATALELFSALGFGHVEVGTVTARAQPGNPRPRIFRFVQDGALINRLGFPSDGAERVAERLRTFRCAQASCAGPRMIIGVNIGKSREVPLQRALDDYLESFTALRDVGDCFILNISSPNTPELRKLQESSRLRDLFQGVDALNQQRRPILVKISPDMSERELSDVLEVCLGSGVAGIIATNTTLSREGLSVATDEAGGLSGAPLRFRAAEVVRFIYERTEGRLPIIGVGGISNSRHALALLAAGASLVQLYTGVVFEGPAIVARLKAGLLEYMRSHNLSSVREIVGGPLSLSEHHSD